MNLANTNYIQAIIEIFGCVITVVVTLMFWIITGIKKKSEKNLILSLFFASLALLVDAGWYIFDGNITRAGFVMNWICNFSIFIFNPIMLFFVCRFICNLLSERNVRPHKAFLIAVNVLVVLTMVIPVSNLFYPWMYSIDDMNVYTRNYGWYAYAVTNSSGIIVCLIMSIVYRKSITRTNQIALYVLFSAPFIGIALQAIFFGISFIQIGIVIGTTLLVANYLIDWVKNENHANDISNDKRKLWLIECIFSIMILIVSASVISCIVSIYKVSAENSEQNSKALTYMVSETIDSTLSEPINVSRTMAQSEIVQDALSLDVLEGTDEEGKMLSFMKRIKNEYGYQMIFIASEKTKAYYTYDGLSRYMDVDGDPKDAWYNEYKARNIKYELNIDQDKDNDMSLAVFVNMEVRDSTGNLLGVCGVAMSLDELLVILSQYENTYKLKISLLDDNNRIQVSTDLSQFEQSFQWDLNLADNVGSITYRNTGSNAILSKYMNGMDWYLVVVDLNPNKINILSVILPSIVIYVLGLAFMIAFSFGFGLHEHRRTILLRTSRRLSETDGLTNLKNRYSLDRYTEKIEKEGIPDCFAVILLDINGLKEANDTFGHDAGDELIRAIAELLAEVFGNYGEIYRTGGDEFLVTAGVDEENVQKLLGTLQEKVNSWRGTLNKELSIAKGWVTKEQYPEESFPELIHRADVLMYEDKDLYYQTTHKERRKR